MALNLKRICVITVVLCMTLMLSACGSHGSSVRKTAKLINDNCDFEYDLLHQVEEGDFAGYSSRSNSITTEYWPPAYDSARDAGEEYVSYSVSPYPSYDSADKFVTMITCSDTSKQFFGLTLLSNAGTIKSKLEEQGFEVKVTNSGLVTKVQADCGNGIVMGFYLAPEERYMSIAVQVKESSVIINY